DYYCSTWDGSLGGPVF
nr:immunoglobulin light chain junction region [Macaca mulatta]